MPTYANEYPSMCPHEAEQILHYHCSSGYSDAKISLFMAKYWCRGPETMTPEERRIMAQPIEECIVERRLGRTKH